MSHVGHHNIFCPKCLKIIGGCRCPALDKPRVAATQDQLVAHKCETQAMTPPKYEIHDSDCPRLCLGVMSDDCHHVRHDIVPCCPGASMVAVKASELAELVEAVQKFMGRDDAKNYARLDTALQPFRRGEK